MENKIFNENNIITMSRIPTDSISGIITSPPYNNGYSDKDNLTEDEYLKVRVNEFNEFSRIIVDRGGDML